MTWESAPPDDPRIASAIKELKEIIQRHYPTAQFVVALGEDPDGVYLKPVVDVDDTEEVFDTVIERLLQMQIEEALPIFVVPVRPPARVAQMIRDQSRRRYTPGQEHAIAGP